MDKLVTVSRRMVVLHEVRGGTSVTFGCQPDPENDALASISLQISGHDWEELGRPTKVTVSIEPGDLLNA